MTPADARGGGGRPSDSGRLPLIRGSRLFGVEDTARGGLPARAGRNRMIYGAGMTLIPTASYHVLASLELVGGGIRDAQAAALEGAHGTSLVARVVAP
jgi:hypothetical protein